MRILEVTPFLTMKRGGSAIAPIQLSIELARIGHDVTIASTRLDYDPQLDARIISNGVRTVIFKSPITMGALAFTPTMGSWLRANIGDFDIIHLHNYRTYQNIVTCRWAVRRKVPFVLQPHGSLPTIGDWIGFKTWFDALWGTRIIRNACGLLAVSDLESRQCSDIGIPRGKTVTIPNGIDSDRFSQLCPTGRFRAELGIGDRQVVLYLGRVHRLKCIDSLVRAFSLALEEGLDAVLVIAGPDDGYKDNLRELANELRIPSNVVFVDFVQDVAQAYRDSDVVVNPASYEIFGIGPFEALLCGRPVIVTDGSGCSEMMKQLQCAYISNPGDVHNLKEKILMALTRQDEARDMAERGSNHVRTELNWTRVAERIEKVYENCIRHV